MSQTTLTAIEVPILFREPHVISGFRHPHQSWSYYLLSIFQWHNECLNIWTHLLATALVILKFVFVNQDYHIFSDPYMRPLSAVLLSTLALYIFSSGAHCLHSRSEMAHYTCFMIDYCGIGLYGLGSSLVHYFYCSEARLYEQFKDIYVVVAAALAILVCACCCVSKTMYDRPYPFTRRLWQIFSVLAIYIWLILPLAQRIYSSLLTGQSNTAITHHCQQIAWFLLAGFFFGSDVPQRFWPGLFDFVGHSHQLFHICISLTTFKQIDGVIADISNNKENIYSRHYPTIMSSYGVVFITALISLLIVFIFKAYVKKKLTAPSALRAKCN